MLKASLFVNTKRYIGEPEEVDSWKELDLEDIVHVIINDSIKKAKDVGKVLTAYSQNFTVPASKKNNQVFKYFHSYNALDGFDARRKHEAILKLNGFDYKKGYIKLNNVKMMDNSPVSYEVQFFGELASLKDILGDGMLHNLSSLHRFDHDYNITNTKNGFENGLAFDYSDLTNITITTSTTGDIKYPLISHTRGFEHDNQGFHRIISAEDRDAGYTVNADDRIKYPDLKPALRMTRIIDAIEWNYPQIKFNKTWMQNSHFSDVFMWLHRTKGYIAYDSFQTGEDTHNWSATVGSAESGEELDYIVGPDGDLRENPEGYFCTRASTGGQFGEATTFTVGFSITATGSGRITTTIRKFMGGTEYGEPDETTFEVGDSNSIDQELSFPYGCGWYVKVEVKADNTVVNITPTVTVIKRVGDIDYTAEYGPGAPIPLTNRILVPFLMPKMKIVDFLSHLFKMFNLVGYEERNIDGSWQIKIEPLDDYYADGVSYDITQYIDISESTVARVTPYGSIDFDWPEPKTFLAINQAEITGDDFGASHFDAQYFDEGDSGSNSLLFDGGNYEVMPKFEKMIYERMTDVDTEDLTDLQWGWFVNDNKRNVPEPTIGAPLLMFIEKEELTSQDIDWNTGATSTAYNRPSSVKGNNKITLHFNAEFDEWTREVNENSLFKLFHSKYITAIYSPYARRFICEAYLPSTMHLKMELNDTMLINNIPFIIDSAKTNLTTGKTMFELLRVTDENTVYEMPPEYAKGVVWNIISKTWDGLNNNWEVT